jgi:hypothetical protein
VTFLGIGVVAFLIDVAAFQAVLVAGASPYLSRLVSFVVATSAAWWLNRTFNFRDAPTERPDLQWARFFAANIVGGTVNFVRSRSTSPPICVTSSAPPPVSDSRRPRVWHVRANFSPQHGNFATERALWLGSVATLSKVG